MALHNLAFVIDVDYDEGDKSDDRLGVQNHFVKRGILYILLHLGYKYGLEKVRWGYKFFRSKSGRSNGSVISRVSDFKELRGKTFEDFEQEFQARMDWRDRVCWSQQKQRSSKSDSVQKALKETLLDFQWDRPDITSPTKLSLRPRMSNRAGNSVLLNESDSTSRGRNLVFIVSQCPLSKTHLMEYLSLNGDDLPTDVTDRVLSKSLNDMLLQKQVVLHWMDCRSNIQVMSCKDHLGTEKLSEILAQVGGRVISVVSLMNICCNHQADSGFMREAFPFRSSFSYLLSSESLYRAAFPAIAGVLQWDQGNETQRCGVLVEPVSRRQKVLQESVEMRLKAVLQGWDASMLTQTPTETWVLQASRSNEQEAAVFQQLLQKLSVFSLHMLAEVKDNGLLYSAVFSPLSPFTSLLTILQPVVTQQDQFLRTEMISPVTAETSPDLPDVVNSVLGVIYDIMNKDEDGINDDLKDHPPEWARQEFTHNLQTPDMFETWFPQSDQAGVSAQLMESMRLLHAVPERETDEEFSAPQQELICGLSELYQGSHNSAHKRSKKRGAHCTPVKQKMKTMSRSLQMLNVARLNVKAQKNQIDSDQLGPESRGSDRPGRRRCSKRNKSEEMSTMTFTSEEMLLSHLKASYDKNVAQRDQSLLTSVQQLLTEVQTFLMAESGWEVKASLFVQQHLLKTSKSIRQLYGVSPDADSKVRECQLQVVLRLELCRLFSSTRSDSLNADQMGEEAAEMLRIISVTKDPVYLARFLQDEILPGFLTAVPNVLGDIYHSLGVQLPDALVSALPADFFSDESVAKESISPFASSPPVSAHSQVSDGKEDLQDLRNRLANKRRSGRLTRHRSMTEATQSLRQIELPKKTTRASKTTISIALEKHGKLLKPEKQETQEVTKVRRNLFNQEIVSPSKKAKLPRSRSVSAVEGLKRKRSHESEERHKLLTKKVCETPIHKQVSSRLLQRQKIGRKSSLAEECIVEESPEKPINALRRSPRIKQLARRHSNVFYSSSQPRSRNFERALSASQLSLSDGKICEVDVKAVQSPVRLLFGAVDSPIRTLGSSETRSTRSQPSTNSSVFESPNKTPTKSPISHGGAVIGNLSPMTLRTPRTPITSKSQSSSRMLVSSLTENLVVGCSEPNRSPYRSSAGELLVVETPSKQSPIRSPLKSILKTPVKASSGLHLFNSPLSRTPKKSVTWSPSPQKCRIVEESTTFKVPKSPNTTSFSSPKWVKSPSKLQGPVYPTNTKRDIFKTPDKICQVNLVRLSEQVVFSQEKDLRLSEKYNRNETPEEGESSPISTPSADKQCSPQLNSRTKEKNPSPTHQMITRSGRTPGRSPETASPCDLTDSQLRVNKLLEGSDSLVKFPAKVLTKGRSSQDGRYNLNVQYGESLTSEGTSVSVENLVEKTVHSRKEEQIESSQPSETNSSLLTESQESDPSHGNSASTDSIDIVDAAVVKAQFNKGLKMNISFSRKPSMSGEDGSSNQHLPSRSTPSRSYGFRQTPDRQQREAAARLGYENDFPRFSTPRGPTRSKRQKRLNPPTYQVELEMQTSGLPKLKIKRQDSGNADDSSSDGGPQSGAQSPPVGAKPHMGSPVALLSKHRDPTCCSPFFCAHVTPAKSTPGKGGSIQTYICHSYTPTHHPAATMSPVGIADVIPLTPSPQSVGKGTPENLNSWPRRKRARNGVFGGKDRGFKGEPHLEELLEEAELGVSRLQDFEDIDEPLSNKTETFAVTSKPSPTTAAAATVSPLSPLEDLFWVKKLAEQNSCSDPQRADELTWASKIGDVKSMVTPPSLKERKPVTASGILALTQSPLLFKGKTGSAQRTPNFKDGAVTGRTEADEVEPVSQPIRRSEVEKPYSRKRLLH